MAERIFPSIERRPIVTPRLVLEPLGAAHEEDIWESLQASRAELRPWLPFADAGRDEEREFVRGVARAWRQGGENAFAVMVDGRASGAVGIRPMHHRGDNLGYWLRSDLSGKGYVTEAARGLVGAWFAGTSRPRIEVLAGVGNGASCRVASKLGFQYEGTARSAAGTARGAYDCRIYSLLREDHDRRGAHPDPDVSTPSDRPSEPTFRDGLVTAIVQDADGTVLMTAHMDAEAYRLTRETGQAWFWSRSRSALWEKGATSGNRMHVETISVDCDGDAVLLRVHADGPACHTGARSCFTPIP